MTRRALFSGSFDPPTAGHEDVIRRAAALYDELFVVIFVNESKKSFFPLPRRLDWLSAVCAKYPNVKTDSDRGFVADYVKRNEIPVIVRGVRDEKDLAYEIPMAKYNLAHGGAETLLLLADEAFADTSSSRVRESLVGGTGDAYPLLPAEIRDEICEKWAFFHQECP